jgi:hypothetical protein
MFYVCLRFVLIRIYRAPWKLLFVFGEGSVCLSKFLVTVEVSVVVERMREEDKRERLERQYLLFTQPPVCYLTSTLFPRIWCLFSLRFDLCSFANSDLCSFANSDLCFPSWLSTII